MVPWSAMRCVTLALVLLSTQVFAAERSVVVTFDDLPAQPNEAPTAEATVALNQAIVRVLRERKIPAIGFVNEGKLLGAGSLEVWLDAGLPLGNHTYSHVSLHKTKLEDYLKEIEHGQEVMTRLLAARGSRVQWFRHPYLQTG